MPQTPIDVDIEVLKQKIVEVGPREVARRTGISPTAVYGFVDNTRSNLRLPTLVKLALACGMEVRLTST
jgi:hypothetical protein